MARGCTLQRSADTPDGSNGRGAPAQPGGSRGPGMRQRHQANGQSESEGRAVFLGHVIKSRYGCRVRGDGCWCTVRVPQTACIGRVVNGGRMGVLSSERQRRHAGRRPRSGCKCSPSGTCHMPPVSTVNFARDNSSPAASAVDMNAPAVGSGCQNRQVGVHRVA